MSSSFIDIGEKGFWARDAFIEVMQICLINEIEKQSLDSIKWIDDFKNELALQSLPMIFGGMSMELEEFLISDERKDEILKLIDVIIEKIDFDDAYISKYNLHEMRRRAMTILSDTQQIEFVDRNDFERTVNYSRWIEADEIYKVKDKYKHAFILLKRLIKGEIVTTASSPEDYWNY